MTSLKCNYKGIPVLVDHECDTTGLLDHCLGHNFNSDFFTNQVFPVADSGCCDLCFRPWFSAPFRCMGNVGGGKNPLLGDALVIAGTLFYAFSNVGEEFCVKKKDLMEVLAMLGVFGAIVSICEIAIFESKSLEAIKWSSTIMSGATIFNLSLLTSDMWAIIIRVFFYKQKVDWLYYLSFGVVIIGIIIYSLNETNSEPARAVEDGNMSIQYKPLNQENLPVGAEVLAN
ncbi:hypothetical protein QJS10_CPA02g00945 [Acorus calamus]|uniref:Uncharacterized protein n=1 Tax=Acorus calamus TaxID=4465 RepID=A0AAV9F9I4_ACOCL|nr:hypothetical protein QJS10_CPA02g00945 [Acorus calamus]